MSIFDNLVSQEFKHIIYFCNVMIEKIKITDEQITSEIEWSNDFVLRMNINHPKELTQKRML